MTGFAHTSAGVVGFVLALAVLGLSNHARTEEPWDSGGGADQDAVALEDARADGPWETRDWLDSNERRDLLRRVEEEFGGGPDGLGGTHDGFAGAHEVAAVEYLLSDSFAARVYEGSALQGAQESGALVDIVEWLEPPAVDTLEAEIDKGVPGEEGVGAVEFSRGDVSADGFFDLTDVVVLILYLYYGGDTPLCLRAADANDSAAVDQADIVTIMFSQFRGTGPLPPPYPSCGPDPSDSPLPCDAFPPCEEEEDADEEADEEAIEG
jgi:hypothetical protein